MSYSFGGLYRLASNGMLARQLNMDNISDNLANIHTPGYKPNRINFQELLNDENAISGTFSASSQLGTAQGSLIITGNSMDWAIEGDGFFGIKLPDGTLGYTRDGTFSLDNAGNIVNSNGYKLDWTGTIPADADTATVETNGTVKARVNGVWSEVGTVKLTIFNNPTGLDSIGENIYKETPNSGTAKPGEPGSDLYGRIRANTIESSAVNYSEEITHLIRTQRGFQAAARALTTTDTMVSQAIRMRQG
ncbi:flagellar basal body rod protein FlgG [Leptolinea sp. HRD-7]|nr:flagellar basal body rod protein FlgG [Leptolinea sp. HRD-7]